VAEGGLPEGGHLLPPIHFPALPGAPAVDTYAVTFSFVVMGAIVAAAVLTRMAIAVRPVGIQNLLEWFMETIEEQSRSILGDAAERFLPLFLTLFLFILGSNLIGLIPGCVSPTASYHTNFAMAIIVALTAQYAGIRAHGFVGYVLHLVTPPPSPWWIRWTLLVVLWPMLHILEEIIRPVSLTMRLFGNLYAKETLLMILAFLTATFFASSQPVVHVMAGFPFLLRVGIILLGTRVSIVQAAVFTILSMVFVSLSMAGHDDDGGHGEAHAPAASH
jgi:F-type H+-transporting ATPase subunit a